MKKNITKYLIIATYMFPLVTFAQLSGFQGLVTAVGGIINKLIPLIFGLAIVYFFWGGVQFIINAGDQKAREDGKKKMMWGVVALFVMISIFGIINFIGYLLEINPGGTINIPTIN